MGHGCPGDAREFEDRSRIANRPADDYSDLSPDALVHGDYKLDNGMFGSAGEPTITNVFDWELSTLGDSLADPG